MKTRTIILSALLAACIASSSFCITGCGNNNETVSSTVSSENSSEAVSSESDPKFVGTEKTYTSSTNIMTGVDDLSKEAQGKRPVAVMVNNIKDSLPQYGISSADVIFETVTEYGITRLMAVYGDYTKVPDVCSIRSCRYYFPIIADGFDAVYFHAGIDKTKAEKIVEELGIDHYDSDERIFSRDQDRLNEGYALEHTMVLHGSQIPALLEEDDVRTDIKKSKSSPILRFADEGISVIYDNGNNHADKIKLSFIVDEWDDYYSTFTYDSNKKIYLKEHNGEAHMDSATNQQLSFTNVFVLETTIKKRDSHYRVDLDWKDGTGYYFSNGCYQKILWSKNSENDNIKITDTDGNEILANAGKSYFGIINKGDISFS